MESSKVNGKSESITSGTNILARLKYYSHLTYTISLVTPFARMAKAAPVVRQLTLTIADNLHTY